jgi:UDP-N-acetylglucosamine--N-acetylmuramyl-(pentapeptide) pyrophosphoryl-undecaprenol N-acetylglucosamine transferase
MQPQSSVGIHEVAEHGVDVKYLLTGGASGGHIYPALAVADEIRRRDPEARFLYVGVSDGIEARVVPERGYEIQFVRSRPFPRSSSPFALSRFALTLGVGVLQAIYILLRFRPHLIFGTGGFVSAPILFASGLLKRSGLSRASIFAYEPNAHPGLLNQAVGRLACRIGLGFEDAGRWFDMKRVAVVGFPVRRELLGLDRDAGRRRLDIFGDRFVVFVFGGSQGSRVINRAIVEALPLLASESKHIVVYHATGRTQTSEYDAVGDTRDRLAEAGIDEENAEWYRRCEYLEQIEHVYAAADLVVCRGGMSTLTEVGVSNLPSIIIPLSTAAEDHQAINARELERRGAATVLYEEALWHEDGTVGTRVSGRRLATAILEYADNPEKVKAVGTAAGAIPRRDSLERIVDELDGLTAGRRPAPLKLEFPSPQVSVPADPNLFLRHVRDRLSQVGGCPEALPPEELAYLRYQADRHLASTAWYEIPLGRRNVGVKLVGHLGYVDRLDLIIEILRSRRAASPMKKALGGDFQHPGILRRNAVEYALTKIGIIGGGDIVRQVLLEALGGDPYFEVRRAAATTLGDQVTPGDSQAEESLIAALDDTAPSVVTAALSALGQIGSSGERLLPCLRRFYVHADWQFRQQTVIALDRLLQRHVIHGDEIADDLDVILATSPNFEPAFPLKRSLDDLAIRVRTHMTPDGSRRAGAGG